jgi:hypothetical protein
VTRSRERLHDADEESPRYRPWPRAWGITIGGVLVIYAPTWLIR